MNLFLFTAEYPYGKGTGFIEDEVPYLSKAFEKIYIIPFHNTTFDIYCKVPDNCQVLPAIMQGRTLLNLWRVFAFKSSALFIHDFVVKRVYKNKSRLKTWFLSWVYANCVLQSKTIKQIRPLLNKRDVLYFYWGEMPTILSIKWKGEARFISRFQATADLWEEHTGNYRPIRAEIAKSLDYAVFISSKGLNYFKVRYPDSRTYLSRLGSLDNGVGKKSTDGVFRIVSCSNVIPLKRVPYIYKCISSLNKYKIEWTHIGSGSEMSLLQETVKSTSVDNVKVNLIGYLPHSKVIDYYKSNSVDCFINLSTSEGVPVSVMEAISFGIPVVATDVGATSEIVNDCTGALVSANPSIDEVTSAIDTICTKHFEPRKFWSENYDARKNYQIFTNWLIDEKKYE